MYLIELVVLCYMEHCVHARTLKKKMQPFNTSTELCWTVWVEHAAVEYVQCKTESHTDIKSSSLSDVQWRVHLHLGKTLWSLKFQSLSRYLFIYFHQASKCLLWESNKDMEDCNCQFEHIVFVYACSSDEDTFVHYSSATATDRDPQSSIEKIDI